MGTGSKIVREYLGRKHTLEVMGDGTFLVDGKHRVASPTAAAVKVVESRKRGKRCPAINGMAFWLGSFYERRKRRVN